MRLWLCNILCQRIANPTKCSHGHRKWPRYSEYLEYSADTCGQTIELSDNAGLLSQCLCRIGQYRDEINKELQASGCGGRLSSHT